MKNKILITGNKGFLGSYLENYLRPDYETFGLDIKDKLDLFSIDSLIGIDTVIHCAAFTSVPESMEKSLEYYKNNVLGTAHIAKLCLDFGVQMIHISSAAILEPESSVYADSKFIAHEIVSSLHKALIFIPYNIYGTKPKRGSLFDRFLYDEKLTIFGDGKQTRDFINIIDICEIIKTAIDEHWEPGTFEVGTGKDISVNEVAKIFQKLTGKEIIHKKQSYGIRYSVSDIEHLRAHYKKPFITNLEKDIEQIINSFN